MTKKILTAIFLIYSVLFIYSEQVSIKKSKNIKGQAVIIEKYRNEADGKYMVEIVMDKEKMTQRTTYYKGNPEYKEKQIDINVDFSDKRYEYGKPEKVYNYYEKNNPKYFLFSVEEYKENELIMTTDYKNSPDYIKQIIQHADSFGNMIFDEVIFLEGEKDNKIKEFLYYINNEVIKIENIYKDNNSYIIKGITYFKSFNDNIKEKEEQYFENHPKALEKIFIEYNEANKKKHEEQYYNSEKEPDGLNKIIAYYYNGIKIREEQFFDKPINGIAYKLQIFYENEKIINIIAYDKDGNVVQDK